MTSIVRTRNGTPHPFSGIVEQLPGRLELVAPNLWDIDFALLGLELRIELKIFLTIDDQACKCWSETNWFGCFKAIDDLSDPQLISVTCCPSSNKLQAQLTMMASSGESG